MKYLLLIRHAKTEQQGYDHDFERELTKRGTEDCKLMAERLKKTGFVPDLIKISTAKRTQQTAKLLAKHLGWKKGTVEGYEKLYLATPNAILNEIVNTNKKINSLVIIGHNPGITELFNFIGNAKVDDLPTCVMGLFKFEIKDWKEIAITKGKLEWYSWPKKG